MSGSFPTAGLTPQISSEGSIRANPGMWPLSKAFLVHTATNKTSPPFRQADKSSGSIRIGYSPRYITLVRKTTDLTYHDIPLNFLI